MFKMLGFLDAGIDYADGLAIIRWDLLYNGRLAHKKGMRADAKR